MTFTPDQIRAANDRTADVLEGGGNDKVREGFAQYRLPADDPGFASLVLDMVKPTIEEHLKIGSSMNDVYTVVVAMWSVGFCTAMELQNEEVK